MAFVGVDLGGTQLRVAVADDRGRLRTVVRRTTEAARGRDHVIKRIVDAVKQGLEEDGTPPRRVRALCSCGQRGDLESIASGTGIARATRELAPATPGSSLHGLEHPQAEDVVRAARAGDELATAILENAGTYLGIAMGTLVNLFNPQLIVLGGSVIKAGNFMLGPMRRSMNASSWKAARRGLRIVRPALGDDVGLICAVAYTRVRARHARLA